MGQINWKDLILRALEEDQVNEDVTTKTFVNETIVGTAVIIAKKDGILCGTGAVEETFALTGNLVTVHWHYREGEIFQKNNPVATLNGNLKNILLGERVALNFLALMSGIATLTNKFVQIARPYRCVIRDTRKTHPGLRDIEKYAVRVGGGENHRKNLSEYGLIKENHIAAAGGFEKILEKLKRLLESNSTLSFELEVETLDQYQKALEFGVKEILLDNFTPEEIQKAVAMNYSKAILEASGGITLENVENYAKTGVDRIAIGAITHSAPPIDFSLRILNT